jgi:hypothetical protein
MSTQAKTRWHIRGEAFVSCNCAWGCPCQFNALPTHGNCEAAGAWQIHDGHFGDTSLTGTRFAAIYHWPGPIHEGNGTRQLIVDQGASPKQREAIIEINSGRHGGTYFEVFASVCSETRDPITAPITLTIDRAKRIGSISVAGIVESRAEPIKNPVTGDEHRARIVLPNGFEYTEAEMGSTVLWRTTAGGVLNLTHENSYAQFNAFDWSNG